MMEHIQQQEMQHQRQAPLSLDEVLRAVLAAASHGPERVAAEQSLRSWEADATPGFLHALVSIVQNAGQVDEVTTLFLLVLSRLHRLAGQCTCLLQSRELNVGQDHCCF